MLFHAKRENKIKYFLCIFGGKRRLFMLFCTFPGVFGQFMYFWSKIKYFYAFFICFFGAKRRPFLSIFCMLFSPRSGEKIFMHFLYAFRAKREKKNISFFKHLCFFDQTLKKTLGPVCARMTQHWQLDPDKAGPEPPDVTGVVY